MQGKVEDAGQPASARHSRRGCVRALLQPDPVHARSIGKPPGDCLIETQRSRFNNEISADIGSHLVHEYE